MFFEALQQNLVGGKGLEIVHEWLMSLLIIIVYLINNKNARHINSNASNILLSSLGFFLYEKNPGDIFFFLLISTTSWKGSPSVEYYELVPAKNGVSLKKL